MNKYFIDCGAHCGESILRAKHQFGNDITTISFEPIPAFAKQIEEIYKNDDTVHVQNSAVWIDDSIKHFHIHKDITDGSSLLLTLNDLDENYYIEIPCFDLSSWIKKTFTESDYIILKLDIEGAEYEVLNKMIEDGTISMVNELWGEWHYEKFYNDEHTMNLAKKVYKYLEDNKITFNIWEMHIPTYGKSHEKLAFRPQNLKDII